MSYIATDNMGRYLGEHTCGREHYGDMGLVRQCCIADALGRLKTADRVAFTSTHPAAVIARCAVGALTEAERARVSGRDPRTD